MYTANLYETTRGNFWNLKKKEAFSKELLRYTHPHSQDLLTNKRNRKEPKKLNTKRSKFMYLLFVLS